MSTPEISRTASSAPRHKVIGVFSLLMVMVTAQVSMPLAPQSASTLVTIVVITLAALSLVIASFTWKPERIFRVLALAPIGLAIEVLGKSTGLPFGTYEYSDLLQPQLLGVPVVVTMAWMGMALAAWEIGRRITSNWFGQAFLGGLAITAWDLFLDPLMVGYGYWSWENTNGWQGIPISNYLGWILVGTLLCAVASKILGPARPNNGLAALYVYMIVFSAFGFLLPFAFDRPLAGAVVLIAALPLIWAAFRPKERPWLQS